MKRIPCLFFLALLTLGARLATAESLAHDGDFSGTYVASLADRAEILNLHQGGTAEITLSDQVTAGAGGLTFSDSLGSWKVAGPRKLTARFLNLNFAGTAFSGIAVVDYVYLFGANFRTLAASCNGKIFAPGVDPLSPSSTPYVEFDCSYLTGHPYQRVTLP
jgi:hypothetical protein